MQSPLQDESFLVEVYSYMKYITYDPGSAIVGSGTPADRLIVVVSGEMVVHVESDDEEGGKATLALKGGDFIGDFALLDDNNWGSSTLISKPSSHIEAYTGTRGRPR